MKNIRVYLEKNSTVEDAFVMILWGNSIEKTSVIEGGVGKLEWKELIVFKNTMFEDKIEVKLLDKNSKSEDDVIGYGQLMLDASSFDGAKQRS